MIETREQLLAEISARCQQSQTFEPIPRELVLANPSDIIADLPARTSSRAREVYKQQNSKVLKYVSRSSEESRNLTSSPLEAKDGVSQDSGVSVIAPATTSSREITGISAQHVRTERGIKINIGIQTAQDAAQGAFVELTGELKKHNRLRELRAYSGDDYEFQQLYIQTITELKEMSPEDGQYICMGRLHQRGTRGRWIANMMIVGRINSAAVVEQIVLNIEGKEFEIALDQELSARQQQLYHNSGVWGRLTSATAAPTLSTMKRKLFQP